MPTPDPVLVALHRFGLGGRPGDPDLVRKDPRGWVLSQLAAPRRALLSADQPAADEIYRRHRAVELRREEARVVVADARSRSSSPAGPMAVAGDGSSGPRKEEPSIVEEVLRTEIAAKFQQMSTTPDGLLERLVSFWTNHFAVSLAKSGAVRVLAGAFEREAIRPHVLGRFSDLLLAAETHPAMLFDLDNVQSTGPHSRSGRNGRKGLNENLAREILELHTLGVDGGYSQADVTSLARILTGWTVSSPDDDGLYGGRFTFAPARHEPGPHAVLGSAFDQSGLEQGRAALEDLAIRPATARHVARKLATHFLADQPPQAVVDRLAARFVASGGDLAAVVTELVGAEEAWSLPLAKVRQPVEFLAAVLRATGMKPDPRAVQGALAAMGQPQWDPPGPNGWPDTMQAWVAPKGFDARLDLASEWGRRNAALQPLSLVSAVLGDAVSPETRQAVSRAESRQQGLAILFMSPEFQRR
jgi:uncharacterized protein (DUF1800 family)